ncbi:MAG: hypothetical protein ACKO7W_06625 [Elainella sp.]
MSKKKRLHRLSRQVRQVSRGVELMAYQLKHLGETRLSVPQPEEFPYAQELITDMQGRVCKVVLSLDDYQQLLAKLKQLEATQEPNRPSSQL